MTESMILATIGCDVGDKQSELCILTEDGRLERPKPLRTTRAGFKRFFQWQPRAHVVIEVGPHSRWISELVEDLGYRVTVANTRKVKLISEGDSKTDRTDAELLARLGKPTCSCLHRFNIEARTPKQIWRWPRRGTPWWPAGRSSSITHGRW